MATASFGGDFAHVAVLSKRVQRVPAVSATSELRPTAAPVCHSWVRGPGGWQHRKEKSQTRCFSIRRQTMNVSQTEIREY